MADSKLNIRMATREDAPAIQAVYVSGRENGFVPDYGESDWRLYPGYSHVKLLVAEIVSSRGRQVIGMLLGYDLVNWGYVDVLAVDPRFRKRRVGSSLQAAFESLGRGCWSSCEAAVDPSDSVIKRYIDRNGGYADGLKEWRIHNL